MGVTSVVVNARSPGLRDGAQDKSAAVGAVSAGIECIL